MMRWMFVFLSVTAFLWVSLPTFSTAGPPAWGNIHSEKIILFYPGLTSWQFLKSQDHALGGKNMQRAKSPCTKCHVSETGEYDIMADDIAAGRFKMKKSQKTFEPDPTAGKKGFLDATLQAAYDGEYLYIRVGWASKGSSWKDAGLAELDLADRVSVQLNKGQDIFKKYGCFISCHNDLSSMPESPSKEEVKKHPYYGPLKRDSVRLYAFYTRKDGGWADIKDKKELDGLLKNGGLVDLWMVAFKGKETEAEDGWVFSDRLRDEKGDVEAEGSWENGRYTVVMKRKLKTGDARDVQLQEGDTVTIDIAVHNDRAGGRKHYVAFPLTIGLGTKGDVRAKKVK
jgi:cytochrome c-type protein NapC